MHSANLRLSALFVFSTIVWAQGSGTVFEGAMTSSGKNRPSIKITRDLIDICALLHRGLPPGSIAARLNLSDEGLNKKLDLLRGEGLLKTVSPNRAVPTAVVVTLEDAGKYFHPDDAAVESAARLLLKKLPAVKAECQKIESFARVPFEAVSFFVLSDVLLDNWQINNVERLFVKDERTQRTGGRYYYTILEKPASHSAEPFAIYGNTGSQWGSVQIGLYGNDRFSGHTLLSIPDADFANMFGFDHSIDLKEARGRLANRMVEVLRGAPAALIDTQMNALSRLGLVHGDKLDVLLLREVDYKALDQVAAVVTKDLVDLLEGQRAAILSTYRGSPYAEETSFNEYLMCWYHFFYTAVTNRLRDKHAIDIPSTGTFTYLIVP